jgi:hypothetical protein
VETDVAAWHAAVTQYKNVVTHFFAYKTEQWHNRFLRNTLGVEEYQGVYEFAKMRGAMHYHSSASTQGDLDCRLDTVLATLCVEINHTLKKQEAGEITQVACDAQKDKLVGAAAVELQELSALHLGMNAQHPGVAPDQWVAPAGVKGSGHREGGKGMLSRSDVRDEGVLRRFKFDEEGALQERLVKVVNVAFTHTCSEYCWRDTRLTAACEEAKHGPRDQLKPHVVGFVRGSDERVIVKVSDCRMGFGCKLTYPRSGCYTGGKPHQTQPTVEFDGNGVPRLVCPRNHPRVLQQSTHVYYWGANADMQRFFTNRKSRQAFDERDDHGGGTYEELTVRMAKAKVGGLEQTSGCVHVHGCTTGYKCKKKGGSKDWEVQFAMIGDDLAADRGDTPLRAMVGKAMNAIAKCRDRSKDEASFMLAGGKLTFSTLPVKTCSTSHVSTEEIKEPNKAGWTYQSLKKKYEARPTDTEGSSLNFYTWCARHGTKATKPTDFTPRFMGMSVFHGLPVSEVFAEEQLQMYRPYKGEHTLLAPCLSWATEFDAFVSGQHPSAGDCPLALRHKMRMCAHKIRFVPGDAAGAAVQGFGVDGLPSGSDDRALGGANDDARGVAEACGVVDPQDVEGDLAALEFTADDRALFDDGAEVDLATWSNGFREEGRTWVSDIAKQFYSNQSVEDASAPVVLPSKPDAVPRNARGFAQQLLVSLALHKLHARVTQAEDPHRHNVYVQGNPGSGKTFTMKVILNAYRAILGVEGSARSIAPTGMAASLTGGTTTYRFAKMPVGKQSFEMPYDMGGSKEVAMLEGFVKKMTDLEALLVDEASMIGRPDFAWLNHRVCEGRRPKGTEGDGNLFGNVPLRMFFQDVMQLPPVAKKALSNMDKASNATGSCHMGKALFDDFLRPPHNSGDAAVTVVMDEVFRQTDGDFTRMLQHMREGIMEDADAKFIEGRCLKNLSAK